MSTDQLNSFALFPLNTAFVLFLNDEPARAIAVFQSSQLSCAWCLREQDKPMGEGSHGICQRHAALMRAQARARRQQREALTPVM